MSIAEGLNGSKKLGVGDGGGGAAKLLAAGEADEQAEEHSENSDGVGEGDHAARPLEDTAEDSERRDRNHEDQAVDHEVPEAQ